MIEFTKLHGAGNDFVVLDATAQQLPPLEAFSRRIADRHFGIGADQVLVVLWQAIATYGIPGYIRSDNGPEFIALKVQQWLRDNHIKTIYIDPGSPWQNGYIESFHSRLRDQCVAREVLLNLREARVVIEDWRQHYNRERPHSKLGYLSPKAFINNQKLTPQVG